MRIRRRSLHRNSLRIILQLLQRPRQRIRISSRCRARGISQEDAVSMIVDGFCKQVFRELPMEFAVEAKKLLEVSLEGSVG